MTTPMPVNLICPCCGTEFESMSLRSTNTCGPLTTDLYRHAGGFPSLPLLVHGCTQCGYSGHIGDFDPEQVTPSLKDPKSDIEPQSTWRGLGGRNQTRCNHR
ncbi:MAG: hypothetical protein NTX53_13980 [candidate division WOR-3 bacterium]|nr:hypothetical protein [candidate division WOR-3 bacterium]